MDVMQGHNYTSAFMVVMQRASWEAILTVTLPMEQDVSVHAAS